MNFKKLMAIVLSFFIIIISGCRSQKLENEKTVDKIQGKITIWTDKKNSESLKLSIEGFKKIHDKATIQVEEVNETDIYNKLNSSLSLHTNIPDVVIAGDEDIQLLLKGFTSNLEETSDDIKKDNYLKYKIDNLTRDGRLLGIPLNCKPGVLIYRKDLFQAAGINAEYIKTWSDFILAGKSITNTDKVPILSLSLEDEKTYRLFLNQLGGSYFDRNGKLAVNTAASIKAAELLKTLYTQGTVQNLNSSANVITLLTQGKAASAIMSLEEINILIKGYPEFKGKLGVMNLPAFEEGGNQAVTLDGENLLILNSSQNKNLAKEFSKFAAENKENIKLLLEKEGMFPAFNNNYDEKWFLKIDPFFEDVKLWKMLSDEAKDIYGINYTESFNTLVSPIKDAIQSIILKGAASNSTLEDLQNKLQIVK
jgi:lactose/L-arabinose transport system substrate-binding protein